MIQAPEIFLSERKKLYDKFADKLEIAYNLSRRVVSFQANKDEPIYRWFKYKEGFSSSLVKYFLSEYSPKPGKVLDPFAGAGTTLFAGQEIGWQSHGIELLPVGSFVMEIREALNNIDTDKLKATIKTLWTEVAKIEKHDNHINHISITKDAFPDETEVHLNKYLTYCTKISDKKVQTILKFAAFSVLEEISYTRKDGQYLRWDYRSKRVLSGKPFDKGRILSFEEAVKIKLQNIVHDLSPTQTTTLFEQFENNGHPSRLFPCGRSSPKRATCGTAAAGLRTRCNGGSGRRRIRSLRCRTRSGSCAHPRGGHTGARTRRSQGQGVWPGLRSRPC